MDIKKIRKNKLIVFLLFSSAMIFFIALGVLLVIYYFDTRHPMFVLLGFPLAFLMLEVLRQIVKE